MKNKVFNTLVLSRILQNKGDENIDQAERLLSVGLGGYLLYQSIRKIGHHPFIGLQGIAVSGLMLYRGATGVCPVYQQLGKNTADPEALHIKESITVHAPREKVFAFWRELSNLPKFMTHLKSVSESDNRQSYWVANTPGNLVDLSWKAEITREEEGSYIGWQSIEGSVIDHAGKVEFRDALNGIDTELNIELDYFPPAGSVGKGIANLFNGVFEKIILDDIKAFRSYAEAEDFKHYAGIS